MAESSANHLNYGFFGSPLYDLEAGEWRFVRTPGRIELHPLGDWSVVHTPSVEYDVTKPSHTAHESEQAQHRLVRDHPLLAPTSPFLSELSSVSEAVLSTTHIYDPLVGDLLSIGTATRGHNSRLVLGLSSGESGNILRLLLSRIERHGWGIDKSIFLQGLSWMESDGGYWNQEAAPIQQVCFAQSEDKTTFLALRLPTKVVILHLKLSDSHNFANQSDYYELGAGFISVNPLIEVQTEDYSGTPHVHVSFNPEYQQQIGVVYQDGAWFVLDIERKWGKWTTSCYVQGAVNTPVDDEDEEAPQDDGWARIMWVGDANTIIVCSRKRVALFDLKAGPSEVKCPVLVDPKSPDWVLDLRKHPTNKHHFFVLTSTRICLLEVTCNNELQDETGVAGANTLISWSHYRDPDDFTLQLSVSDSAEEETIVLLYSRLNSFAIVFQFQMTSSDSLIAYTISDPSLLRLDGLDMTLGRRHISQLHLRPLHFGEREKEIFPGPGRTYLNASIKFYELTAMLSERSVHRIILYAKPHTRDLAVEDLAWRKIVQPQLTNTRSRDSVDDLGDFIVPNGFTESLSTRLKPPFQAARVMKSFTRGTPRKLGHWNSIYDTLADQLSEEVQDIVPVLENLGKLTLGDSEYIRLKTLLEFAGSRMSVTDIDETSEQLKSAVPNGTISQIFQFQQIAPGRALGLAENSDQETTVSTVYDMILQDWIAPLPKQVPAHVRQIKELLARRIAVEVMLASTSIRSLTSDLDMGATQQEISSSPPLPTPPASTGSSQPNSSRFNTISSSSPTSPPTTHSLARLGQHLAITKSSPPQPLPGCSQILAHWQLNADPSTYSWTNMERALEPDEDPETSQKLREKAKRKEERRLKRQKRENEILKSKADSTRQAVTSNVSQQPRSSPGPLPVPDSSSQIPSQTQSQGIAVQSQAEPGKHGGRPVIKKKKGKARMSGF